MLALSKHTVFFVTNNYKPYAGGIVSSIEVAAHALRNQGYRVVIITLDFNASPYEPDVYRVTCPFKFNYKSNPMALPLRAGSYIEELIEAFKPALIHAHHPFLLGTTALKVARKKKLPIVFTYHTLYDQYLHYLPVPQRLSKPVVEWLVQRFCMAVDGIILPSKTVQHLVGKHYSNAKLTVVPSGILPLYVHKQLPLKPSNQYFELLCVSRFAPEKNIGFLLETFKRLNSPAYKLTLIGFGSETEKLKHYAYTTLQLPYSSVRFIIKPSKQELSAWYTRANSFIFASQTETQGIVLAEAMAHGTPVIALPGPGVSDIVVSGKNGFLVDSQEEMVEKLLLLKDNPVLLQTLQYEAWQTARAYVPEHIGHQLHVFYEKILKK